MDGIGGFPLDSTIFWWMSKSAEMIVANFALHLATAHAKCALITLLSPPPPTQYSRVGSR